LPGLLETHVTMSSIDRKKVAADWAKKGFSCELWIDSPGQRWEDFTHATDELVVVLEGKMEFEIAGRVCHPEIGEELLIPAGALHSARNIGKSTTRWLYGYKR
jgi:mannose-6-phosphate isomerase-like protein (cupin superfamily)